MVSPEVIARSNRSNVDIHIHYVEKSIFLEKYISTYKTELGVYIGRIGPNGPKALFFPLWLQYSEAR
ncbi:hypothetical protein SuNHUV7_22340 (plasmid) [Pseudoseohaeicola sp. NH-UV-7]